MLDPKQLGHALKRKRRELDLTLDELAERTGMSDSWLSRLENGLVRSPKIEDLSLVARALGIPPQSLFGMTDIPPDPEGAISHLATHPELREPIANLLSGYGLQTEDDRRHIVALLRAMAERYGKRRANNTPATDRGNGDPSSGSAPSVGNSLAPIETKLRRQHHFLIEGIGGGAVEFST